jgi:TPR repeat protein
MLYILTSTETILNVDVRVQESRVGDSNVEGVLNLKLKQTLSSQSFEEQQAYLTASATAAYVSFNKLDQRHRFRASVNLLACNNEIFNFTQGSSSSGLGYALACFDAWWRINLQKNNSFAYPVFSTGEVLTSGHIKAIGHIVEKLESTCKYVEKNQGSISSFYLCYPQDNDKDIPEALRKCLESLGGILIPSERLQYTLGQLLGDDYDGDPLGRWQPFKGLKSFDYEDSVRFFGRDKDVERLYSDIKQNSGLLIVSGASGTGKSSLIKAGLIPKLEQEHDELHWAYCTPNSLKEGQGVLLFILEQLLIAWDIKKQNIDELVSTLNHSIEEGITSLSSLVTPETKQCLLYLDQYEEVFSQSEQDIESIGSELSIIDGLAKALSKLNIVLAIRNEYLGRLLDNQALRSPIISNVASQLTSQEWEAIVHEQALFSGITFEPEGENNEALDTIIIEEAIKTPYALPMVSFLLEQLYSKAIEEKTNATVLQHKHYQALGGLTGAIAYRASSVLQESDASEKTTSTFFDYFVGVNPEGLPFARCVELADIASNKTLYHLVKGFIDANLIVSVAGDTDNSAVKLAHDSLFTHWEALKAWIEGSKEYLLWRYSIDGQFTRWQQATTNKADYLLKDNQLLKEGKDYLKLNLIRDSKLKGYLSASLKQKSRKQLSVFFVFIILPLLLAGIYQWDKHRIKTYYYSAIGERWSVPFGLNELTDEQVSHRTFSYKMEYQGGVLKRLVHVNSYNTLTIDELKNNTAIWEYKFSTDGMIQSIVAKDQTKKVIGITNFQFDGKERAIADLSSKFGKKNFKQKTRNLKFLPYFNPQNSALNHTNSDISQHLLTYSIDGYLIKKEFQNAYGTKKPIRNQYYGVKYEYDQNGQIKLEYYIDDHGSLTSGESNIAKVKYEYDHFGNILNKDVSDKNEHGGIIQFSFDEWGNQKEKSYHDKLGKSASDNGIAKISNDIDQRGNITKTYLFDINGNLKESPFSIAIKEMKYDPIGRLNQISFFNGTSKFVNNKEGYAKQVIKHDTQGHIIEVMQYDKYLKPTPNHLGCISNERTYNENSEILSDACLNENGKLTPDIQNVAKYVVSYNQWGFKKQMSFFGENDQLTLNSDGFAKVVFEIDMKGNTLSESYFGTDGKPIRVEGDSVKNTYKYDDQNNVVEQSFWDEQGNLTEIDGLAILKNDYDDLGRNTQEYYLDKMGQPILRNDLNYYKQITQYSKKGNYIASINYFDVNGNILDLMSRPTEKNSYPIESKNTKILSTPGRAKVFIDNKFVGLTPFHKHVPLGKHELKIVKANYLEITSTINIIDDEVFSLNFNLPISPKTEDFSVQSLNEKAQKGDSLSQSQLGDYYTFTETNYDLAKIWYEKAANNGSTEAMHHLGLIYIWSEDTREKGVYWLQQAANSGVLQSQYILGYEYLTGAKISINDVEAQKWLTIAAHKGHASAQYELGRMNNYGWGMDKDSSIAFKWYLIAATEGNALSCNALASLYRKGEGAVKNLSEAFYWNMLGAELGNENSYYRVGEAYLGGAGVNKDTNKAILWLMKAFQSKDKLIRSGAAGMLGLIYENGKGVRSDFEKAFFFNNKALEDDNFPSAFPLAYMYLQGHGVEVNYTKAVELFEISHSKGDKRATQWLTQNGEI